MIKPPICEQVSHLKMSCLPKYAISCYMTARVLVLTARVTRKVEASGKESWNASASRS